MRYGPLGLAEGTTQKRIRLPIWHPDFPTSGLTSASTHLQVQTCTRKSQVRIRMLVLWGAFRVIPANLREPGWGSDLEQANRH